MILEDAMKKNLDQSLSVCAVFNSEVKECA